jgi:hypothetical protein
MINSLDELYRIYQTASWWKRTFNGGRFKKEFEALWQKNQANAETLLRCLSSTRRIGWRDDQRNMVYFIERFLDKGYVRLFAFLCCILDEKQYDGKSVGSLFSPIYSIFSTLYQRNGVIGEGYSHKPSWEPGIPCLLEALIQLISAEKTKYKVNNNRWPSIGSNCWQVAAEHAIELVDLAVPDLAQNPLYAGIQLDEIATFIKKRAADIRILSDVDAKNYTNYREVNGDPPGSFKPTPGHCQVLAAAASKQVNFVQELRTFSQESGAALVFKVFLGQ